MNSQPEIIGAEQKYYFSMYFHDKNSSKKQIIRVFRYNKIFRAPPVIYLRRI